MIVVLVSNSASETAALAGRLAETFPECECLQFTDPLLSAKYIWNNPVDIVLAADRMRPVNGIDLLKNIRSKSPELPVVLVAEDGLMRARAEKLAVDGYWNKPVTAEQLAGLGELLRSRK